MNSMSDDPSWRRNCQSLAVSLRSLQKKISIIQRSIKKVVIAADINREREKISECTRSAKYDEVASIEDALKKMERFIKLNPSLTAEGAKMLNDAQQTLQEYQQACDRFYNACLTAEERSRKAKASMDAEDDDEDEEDESNALLESNRHAYAKTLEQQLHNEIVAELERETNEISENVRDVKVIFQHIAQLVQEQGVQLNEVDGNLMRASQATHNGTQQLERARNHQATSTGTKWMVIAVLIFSIFIVLHLLSS